MTIQEVPAGQPDNCTMNRTADFPITICLACSHGGHLNEMLQLAPAFEGHRTFYFCYDADTTRRLDDAYLVPNMARNPVELLKNLVRVFRIFRKEKPDLIVSTGAEIALPVIFIGKLFRVPALYIECGAQVMHKSFTGRIMYWLADEFYVQWPELLEVYGSRALYDGSLVDEANPI
jgi:beta-1,4-N-acetylglucosaminyltransferase